MNRPANVKPKRQWLYALALVPVLFLIGVNFYVRHVRAQRVLGVLPPWGDPCSKGYLTSLFFAQREMLAKNGRYTSEPKDFDARFFPGCPDWQYEIALAIDGQGYKATAYWPVNGEEWAIDQVENKPRLSVPASPAGGIGASGSGANSGNKNP